MKKFETCGDAFILPDMFTVVRLDAHRIMPDMWKDVPDSDYPLSDGILEALVATAKFVVGHEIRCAGAYIHGDEISLLLDTKSRGSERRKARLISMLSSTASVGFFSYFMRPVSFHAKVSELPTVNHVVEYFIWQRLVAERNFYYRTISLALSARGEPPSVGHEILSAGIEKMKETLNTLNIFVDGIPQKFLWGTLVHWNEQKHDPVLVEIEAVSGSNEEYAALIEKIVDVGARRSNTDVTSIPTRRLSAPPQFEGQNREAKPADSPKRYHDKSTHQKNKKLAFRSTTNVRRYVVK
jgi:tRNA(His) 5'-end guanylyltransferase